MADITLPNGVTLVYDDEGDREATPVVLLHGVSMSRRYFHKQVKSLSRRFRILALDLRGHGGSEKTETGHTVPQYARDLRLFLEELMLVRPVLLGWSMGAFVAWDYIKQFGCEPLGGLIISDEAASDFKWDGFPHGFIDLPTLHALMTAIQDDRHAFLNGLVRQMFHLEQPQSEIDWMVSECSRLPTGAASAILFDQSVQDYRDVVSRIDLPTLICWGRHDALLPIGGGHDLRQRIRSSELIAFENSGHCPFIEESDKFNHVVEEFVVRL